MSLTHQPPRSTLFPYTTLFRSHHFDLKGVVEPGVHELHRDSYGDPRCGADAPGHLTQPPEDLGEAHERSEEHTSELQSRVDLVCRLLLEKKKQHNRYPETSTGI